MLRLSDKRLNTAIDYVAEAYTICIENTAYQREVKQFNQVLNDIEDALSILKSMQDDREARNTELSSPFSDDK